MSDRPITVVSMRNCSRCGGEHHGLEFVRMARPFAPLEAAPLEWTHFASCPTNGDPILMVVVA